MLVRMSTYSVVVALHIIAVVAAYGLPLSAPLIVPYVRRHHPDALPGLHAAQHFVNNAITGPFTVLLLAFGLYLATDGDRWGDPFVTIGIGAVAIIAVVGGGVVVPAVKALAGLDPRSARVRPRLPALSAGRDASSAPWSCSRSSRWRPNRSHKRISVALHVPCPAADGDRGGAPRPPGAQARRHRPQLRLPQRGGDPGGRPAQGEGRRARRPRRDHAPERPVLRGGVLRHPARGRRRGADERAAQGARGRLLPVGLGREGRLRLARVRRGRDRGRVGGRRRG